MNRKDLRITVIYGGISSEREVSLRSGKAMFEALQRCGYRRVSLFDLTCDSLGELLATPMDLAVLALHGKGGEDGCIQGMLELAGIPYTGSSVAASAIGIDKIRTKELISYAGLPTPCFVQLNRSACDDQNQTAQLLKEKIGLPMVLKSPCEGSSIGVRIVKDEAELPEAIGEIFSYGNRLLAEEFLDGVELTLPILGNEVLTVLPAVEITSENEFYDYQAKYTKGMCHHLIPARISAEELQRVNEIGKEAYRTIGCEGLSRIDFILDRNKGPMLIEVNTLPGMTEMSLFPDSARYVGIPFEELVDRIVCLALEKVEKKIKREEL
ncbi:MAG: D-alanine--D-alanine ligase [Clostridia bacterium]|nr:D-alanine--D-alanine ligase [Clostridia bacterium]